MQCKAPHLQLLVLGRRLRVRSLGSDSRGWSGRRTAQPTPDGKRCPGLRCEGLPTLCILTCRWRNLPARFLLAVLMRPSPETIAPWKGPGRAQFK